ncbi:FkbM family methyltransferase [Cylindrospermum sp. FACHB-282]|nr:FkbM family methyltransferase [Cylindrospermum sp. FACHB-282]
MSMKCKVCASDTDLFAQGILLGKYEIDYFQCSNCGFVQTEEPYWLEEAYSDAIAKTDVGLVCRNNNLSHSSAYIIFHLFNHEAKFLDYGGDYGLFVRIMRDLGFDFYWIDKFCTNLFAKGFEIDKSANGSYELVTAFEVFEHFVNPIEEIENILKLSRNILFSTELLPKNNPKPNEWWYYAPYEGQHISIYTCKTLQVIADKYNLNLYTNGSGLHLLTEKKLAPDILQTLSQDQPEAFRKESLLQSDYSKAVISLMNIHHTNDFGNLPKKEHDYSTKNITILVDGVFFQLYKTGIARVWKSLLEEWLNNGFAKHIVVLDRAGTAPKISGIKYRDIAPYDYNNTDDDREMLQQVCDEEGADLFISSYYTTPTTTPSVFMAYDMIPEVMGWNMNNPMWQEKHQGIQHASSYIAISEHTARDLANHFTDISIESITVAHCGVNGTFSPAKSEDINAFKKKYCITKPYFILVGGGSGYKNSILFFQSLSQLASSYGFEIVFTGSGGILAPEFRAYTSGSVVHLLQLSDEELITAYSGAVALVYPSKYEGFGMPIVEAMACGCPVITCPNASIPEVAGEAAIYVNEDDVVGLANALCEVQKPSVRNSLISAGLAQAKKFSWTKMAKTVSSVLIDATLLSLNLKEINLIIFPDWSQPEESLSLELEEVIKVVATHPNSQNTTLLIDKSNMADDDAEVLLYNVTMNLLMQEDVEITEGLEISLVGNLAEIQWEALLPRIRARIILIQEDQQSLSQVLLDKLSSCKIDDLSNQLYTISKEEKQIKYQLSKKIIAYNIKEISINLPHDHALPHYQNRFRLYDKFIGVIAKYLPNSQDFIVDIGANVGDTTALLLQYCLNPIICIEADEEFFHTMKQNLSEYNQRIIFVNSFVSGNDFQNVELVKNSGTARAVERENKIVRSDSLESILKNSNLGKCILLKTDTDGFDFEILLSSLSIIKEDSPILYWENEISSLKDIELAKDLLYKLAGMNYSKYIVLDNFGNPLTYEGTPQLLEQINEYLFNNIHSKNNTFYYTDIVAFPDKYSHLISQIASEYNAFIRSSKVYP